MPWTTTTTRSAGYSVTAAVWNSEHVDNFSYLREVAYQEITADATLNTTTVGTAVQIVSAGAVTYEAVPHMIQFYAPHISSIGADVNIILRDSTTVIGTMGQPQNAALGYALNYYKRITPTAASHTYNIAGWLSGADTVTIEAGSGGTAGNATTFFPAFIRIYRVPT